MNRRRPAAGSYSILAAMGPGFCSELVLLALVDMSDLRQHRSSGCRWRPCGTRSRNRCAPGGLRSVQCVDCAQPPIDKACGEGIMPDGLAALAALGVHVDARQTAPFRGIRFINGAREVEASFPCGVGYGIRRTLLHQVLVDRASECGVSLHWGRRITGLSPDGLEVEGEVVSSRWLVCADGQNSKLRKLSGLDPARATPAALRISPPLPRYTMVRIRRGALERPRPDVRDAGGRRPGLHCADHQSKRTAF